jgi:4'-phosphopantetheinyl transferase
MSVANFVLGRPNNSSSSVDNAVEEEITSHESLLWMEPAPYPVLAEGALHIWQAKLDRPEGELAELANLLSADEHERAARFHFERDRQHYLAGRGILRNILARYVSQPAENLVFGYGSRGKPSLAGAPVQFNLAHSGGVTVIAVARRSAVGIDIEQIRVVPRWEGVTNSFFSAGEREAIRSLPSIDRLYGFFTCWTRKEAYLKATGDGIGVPLDRFDVSVIPGSQPRLLHVEDAPEETGRWHFHALPLTTDFIGVAAHDGPIDVVQHFHW